jgi:hypothetical protein
MSLQTYDETLQLYVIGTKSGEPGEWSPWDELVLVVAASADDARSLVPERAEDPVHAVMGERGVLVSMPEPAWGDDT